MELPAGSRERCCAILKQAYQALREEFPDMGKGTTLILMDFYLSQMKVGKLETPERVKVES